MFPIAHAWLVEQFIAQPSPAHYLGCVWPDMLFEGPLSHPQTHRNGLLLARQAADRPHHAELHDFVIGVLTHGSEPRGFDWYSDEHYRAPAAERGYAFQRAKPLAEQAAAACGLSADQGWWKAHNLVEMAFELSLYAERPARGDALAAACADAGLVAAIAAPLADAFGVPREALAHAMRRFQDVSTYQPGRAQTLGEAYAAQVRHKHPGSAPDVAALSALIEQARALIAPDARSFLADCVHDVGAMLRRALPT